MAAYNFDNSTVPVNLNFSALRRNRNNPDNLLRTIALGYSMRIGSRENEHNLPALFNML